MLENDILTRIFRKVKLNLGQQMHGFDVGMGGAIFQAEGTKSEIAQQMVGCLGAEMVLNKAKKPTNKKPSLSIANVK